MGVMDKLKIFVVKEPVVAASCLIAGFGNNPTSPPPTPNPSTPCPARASLSSIPPGVPSLAWVLRSARFPGLRESGNSPSAMVTDAWT
jgi:hypothetical protein